ncbi:hypothetical protein HRbin11_01318 [bacterium HR11]|nr:hypothetical protein HRbin11_01318 [bacterium HR11]
MNPKDASREVRPSHRRWDRWVFVLYLLYALANTYPYSHPAYIGRFVPDKGDPLFDLWQMKWFARQLFRDPRHLWDANVLHPLERAMTFNDSLLGLALLGLPIGGLTGDWVLARNVLFVLGFLLSAWSTYRLARLLGASDGGALVAGLLYGFCSIRFHHATNLKLVFGPLIPLFFYYLTRWARTGRAGSLLGAFLTWAFQMISSMYYGFFLFTLGPLYGAWMRWNYRGHLSGAARPGPRWHRWAALGIGTAVGLGLVFGVALPYWETSFRFGLRRSMEENAIWSAVPGSYLATGARLGFTWWGHRWWDGERVLWPGALAVTALAALPWRNRTALGLWGLATISFLLSLGPQTPVFRVAYGVLPYFSAMRYPARWGIMTIFFLALLAGLGTTRLLQDLPDRVRRWALAGLLVVGLIDLWHAPLRALPIPAPPPIYRVLAAAPEPGAVAVFPLYSNFREGSTFYAYWTTFHWKPVIGTYAAWAPPSHEWIRFVLKDWPLPHALWLAQYLDIRYIIFHPESFRNVGTQDQWERYRRLMTALLPPEWVLRRKQELEDVLLVLNLEQIRRDLAVRPPTRWNWQSPASAQVLEPAAPAARQAMTDGDPETAWVTRYTDDWHVTVDFGREVSLQALRVFTDSKDKVLYLWGSSDGSSWRPVYTVPWWVWAGAHVLPDGRTYPDPTARRDRLVFLCAPNRIRYLKLTASPVAGHIAVRELQVILLR